jgi:DNA-binding IclR family transcriptional regulator
MERFFDQLTPGRWPQLRPMTEQERKATALVEMEIEDAAAKIREGGPGEDEADLGWPVWAGHVPIRAHQRGPVGAREGVTAPLNHALMPDYDWNRSEGG